MADDAGGVLHRLVVDRRRRRPSRCELRVLESRVALQAELIEIVASQQTRIRRAVWRMAERASLGFHHGMLIDERTGILLMALDADRIVLRGGLRHAFLKRAMRIVTVGACHQPLVDPVMEGLGERGFHVLMARVTKSGLRNLEQIGPILRFMNTVAVDTTYLRLAVSGAVKALMISLVTFQAMLFYGLRRGLSKAEYLGRIAARLHMRFSWTVATFARNSVSVMLKSEFGVRVIVQPLGFFFVAHGAPLCAHKVSRGWCGLQNRGCRWSIGTCSRRTCGMNAP